MKTEQIGNFPELIDDIFFRYKSLLQEICDLRVRDLHVLDRWLFAVLPLIVTPRILQGQTMDIDTMALMIKTYGEPQGVNIAIN